jgi:hypothetical protein
VYSQTDGLAGTIGKICVEGGSLRMGLQIVVIAQLISKMALVGLSALHIF